MFQIIKDKEIIKVVTDELEIYIKGDFEIKRITPNEDTSDVIIETKTTLADFLPQECQFHQEKARPNRLKFG